MTVYLMNPHTGTVQTAADWAADGYTQANAELIEVEKPMHITARDHLKAFYLDYFNNYLTRARYGEDNGLTEQQASALLALARAVYNSDHPEA